MSPMAPVRPTWVPPHADRSKSAISMRRSGPSSRGLLAKRQRLGLGGGHEPDRDRPVFPHDAVGFVHGALDLGGRCFAREIDRRLVRAHVKAHGAVVAGRVERRGQHVLAGVLLHVIEAARPVDRGVHRRAGVERLWRREHVDDLVVRDRRRPRRQTARCGRCRTAGRRTWDRTRFDRASPHGRPSCSNTRVTRASNDWQ